MQLGRTHMTEMCCKLQILTEFFFNCFTDIGVRYFTSCILNFKHINMQCTLSRMLRNFEMAKEIFKESGREGKRKKLKKERKDNLIEKG